MNFSGIPRGSKIGELVRLPLALIPGTARLPILQGRLRGYWWIAGSANHGCWLGGYEHDKQRLFERTIKPGAVVYDVGANVGFYTLLASELVGPTGKVMAFEPLPRNLWFLRQHLQLNKLKNVEVFAAAVSKDSGDARFDDSRNVSMGQLASGGHLLVRTVSLDSLLLAGAIPPPSHMKIDVEGAEERVLAGAEELLTKYRPTIFLATHGDGVRARCFERLANLDYQIDAISGSDLCAGDEFLATPHASNGR